MKKEDWIEQLGLQEHPEGGYYHETYRNKNSVPESVFPEGIIGSRQLATAIYFLIDKDNFSAFHRIKSDETWHFYYGSCLEVVEIDGKGKLTITRLGIDILAGERPQYTVQAGNWFASRVRQGGNYAVVGCSVYPGFDFRDFELAERKSLIQLYPEYSDIINSLTRQ